MAFGEMAATSENTCTQNSQNASHVKSAEFNFCEVRWIRRQGIKGAGAYNRESARDELGHTGLGQLA